MMLTVKLELMNKGHNVVIKAVYSAVDPVQFPGLQCPSSTFKTSGKHVANLEIYSE